MPAFSLSFHFPSSCTKLRHPHAAGEIVQIEFFVRRMRVVVGKASPKSKVSTPRIFLKSLTIGSNRFRKRIGSRPKAFSSAQRRLRHSPSGETRYGSP